MKLLLFALLFSISAQASVEISCPVNTKGCTGNGYLTYLPDGYDPLSPKLWPLVIFLHGAGQRGDGSLAGLEVLKQDGIPKLLEAGKKVPAIIVSPQIPNSFGNLKAARSFYNHIVGKYKNVDLHRVTLTGLSLGGIGCYFWGSELHDVLAGIAGISGENQAATPPGGINPICNLVGVPFWEIHGDQDTQVPYKVDVKSIADLTACGGHPIFTTYPGVSHDAWDQTYSNQLWWDWVLGQYKL